MSRSQTVLSAAVAVAALGLALSAVLALPAARSEAADVPRAAEPAAPKAGAKPATYISAEEAGPDFQVQGEYEGTLTAVDGQVSRLGAQVIALGDGTFRAVLLPGGLPGAGWDEKTRTRIEIDGKTEGGKTVFAVEEGGYSAEVAGDAMTGRIKNDTFALRKVERRSPTLGAQPPEGAVVLFDGTSADAWEGGRMDARKLLAAGATSKQKFQDFVMHLEFATPFKPGDRGQGRGNSGVYIQERYEVQVLDSFGLKGLDNECGGIYKRGRPSVNMCLPPLAWQTYDVEYTAPRLDESGNKTKNAVLTLKFNGVVVYDKFEIEGPTGGAKGKEGEPGGIYLQAHGNPVFFRNIWVVEKK